VDYPKGYDILTEGKAEGDPGARLFTSINKLSTRIYHFIGKRGIFQYIVDNNHAK